MLTLHDAAHDLLIQQSINHSFIHLDDYYPIIRSSYQSILFISSTDVSKNPRNISHLTFGHNFNQSISPGLIPSPVTHLTFGTHFDQPMSPDLIPLSVRHLSVGGTVITGNWNSATWFAHHRILESNTTHLGGIAKQFV